jgi:hypothetical protein
MDQVHISSFGWWPGNFTGRHDNFTGGKEMESKHADACRREAEAAKEYIDKPPHYNRGKIECLDYIEDQGLCFHLGNVVKYIVRAGHKETTDKLSDLRKARHYLDRYITNNERLTSEIFKAHATEDIT